MRWQGECSGDGVGGDPSPSMSLPLRAGLWVLSLVNAAVACLLQKVVVEGAVADWIRRRFPSERPTFEL